MLNAEEMSLGEIQFGVKQPNNSRLKEEKRKQGLGFQLRGCDILVFHLVFGPDSIHGSGYTQHTPPVRED